MRTVAGPASRGTSVLTAGTVMLALGLAVVVALIVRPRTAATAADVPAGTTRP
ncbi:MAG TPA: hypothetical protein VGP02_04125 [Mycobacteriales bacterium]|jgi:hypothetical protein|nr:hypothetical protein [Mycobacteriales bacterium]